jgi:hypothetical protein
MGQIPQQLFPEYPRPTNILEVGAGRFETSGIIWTPTIERMTLDADQSYLGVDIGAASSGYDLPADQIEHADAMMHSYWDSVRAARPNEAITFEQLDATNLPYGNETFDRVVASNLYGCGADDPTLVSIFTESDRLLTRGGEIVIHDDHTPRFYGRGQLVEWFNDNGLSLAIEPHRLMPTRATFTRYGLPTHEATDPDAPAEITELRRDRFRNSTLWILGKSSFVRTVESF